MNKNVPSSSKSSAYREKTASIVAWLHEKKAVDVVALDVSGMNAVAEAIIIVSATNVPHAQTLADWTMEKLGEQKWEFLGLEGYNYGNWILLDCNEVLLHIFQQEYRDFYNLEGLWKEAPSMKGV
ncbi:MAG: ribosome silencing factor [Thermodesulfobacteriota bacterium]